MEIIAKITIPDGKVPPICNFFSIKKEELLRYDKKSTLVDEKTSRFLNYVFALGVAALKHNNQTYDLIRDLPEHSKKLLLKPLGFNFGDRDMKGKSFDQIVAMLEEKNHSRIIFTEYNGAIVAYMIPRREP